MLLIETRLRAKSVAILHLAFPLRYFQMALLKAALIISSEDFEKKNQSTAPPKIFLPDQRSRSVKVVCVKMRRQPIT